MIEQLDLTIRIAAAGAGVLLSILVFSGQIRRKIKIPLCGMLIGSIAYLFNNTPLIDSSNPYDRWIDLASLLTPFWIWIFARRLFEREPRPLLAWISVSIFVLCWFPGNVLGLANPLGFYIIHILSLVLIVDLVRIALTDRADDLIEKRRLIRLWLPLLVAAQAGGILLFELLVGAAIAYPPVQLANAILIFALILFAGTALFKPDPELLLETAGDPTDPLLKANTLSPSEKVLKDKVEQAMGAKYYRTPGLSIASLADYLETPEHRLRALINQRLGYRNFSAFLNGHRIAEAKAILANPDKVDLPVLTIAMDLGYNSLPTFNRAFRSETSVTPTDFRKSAIGQN
ncbi:helix-turn-helix domain-containing protein [Erythrobacter sp. W53]|uniref:AraC family transcriptional regulator n=1 Tax=Erythrobacter sp. W53 TaxID=3425947 RepID=UPI003D769F80